MPFDMKRMEEYFMPKSAITTSVPADAVLQLLLTYSDGLIVGRICGGLVRTGALVGLGVVVGVNDGRTVGCKVGNADGIFDGLRDGIVVGLRLGVSDGNTVGILEGLYVGSREGR